MNKTKLFQLFDLTAGAVSGPIMAFNREAPAIREFHAVLAMGDKSQPGRYPEQFILVELGEQDTDTGEITGRTPDEVASGSDWLKEQARNDQIAAARANVSQQLADRSKSNSNAMA